MRSLCHIGHIRICLMFSTGTASQNSDQTCIKSFQNGFCKLDLSFAAQTPPRPGDLVFDSKWPSFELDLEITKTNMLCKIHDDCLKNVTTRVTPGVPVLNDLEIIKTNILSNTHDDCFKNVTARVLTRFYADLARSPSFWPHVTQFQTYPGTRPPSGPLWKYRFSFRFFLHKIQVIYRFFNKKYRLKKVPPNSHKDLKLKKKHLMNFCITIATIKLIWILQSPSEQSERGKNLQFLDSFHHFFGTKK